MTTFNDILNEFREAATSKRDLGDKFERLVATYLVTDPQYADRLSDVWLWSEWPDRWAPDVGIDLVARERGTGDYWAIQCKFYGPEQSIQKADIDSFFTASGKRFATTDGEKQFALRMIVSTTDKWSVHAEDALVNQVPPVTRLWFKDLADSPIDWSQFSLANVRDIRLRRKKELRPHQEEAIQRVIEGYKENDRGKLVMACGTGKTFTALRLAEQMTGENGRILFLTPSISLVSQSLREWTAEAATPIHAFVVCSDTKVGQEEEDIRIYDLAYPATTDASMLADAVRRVSQDRRVVVFSTYQSIQVVADAQRLGVGEFDLIVCDEAHRTTGLTLPGEDPSDFVKVHRNDAIRGRKRLYMTATPRIYGEASKTKAAEAEAVLFSMDDEQTYGHEFYRLGFGKAVELDLLSEYKVLIVAVKENDMAKLANNYNDAFKLDDRKAIDIRFATKIVGSWKGLSKQGLVLVGEDGQEEAVSEDTAPMRRAVAFSKSIKDSRQTTEVFASLVDLYRQIHDDAEASGMVRCQLEHVDGGMNALKRANALDWLKADVGEGECRILSNARCLSEGIDVPALDAVVFFDTRESIVDIIQSVGRVMRKAPGKRYGYIILPVCIPSEKVKDYNAYIESDPQFKGIWKVIKALRAHDESLVDEAEFRRKIKVIGEGSGRKADDGRRGESELLPLDFPVLPLDAVSEAVYAAIPKKLGDREYWSEWAKGIAQVAERLIARIRVLIASSKEVANEFKAFVKGLQDTLNPFVSDDDAIEMLAQHILTLPVFQALFAQTNFPENNPVGRALQRMVAMLDTAAVASETEGLSKFYDNVRERIALAKSDKSKQEVVRNLYDTFFHPAFPRLSDRLGIVYTPVPVVDFMLRSAEVALKKHFGQSLSDENVHILDPFTGTGTFLVRLIQSGLVDREAMPRKYRFEMHANEIVLLAYYIASINIETAYHSAAGEYAPFEGIVLTDTFQMTEEGDLVDRLILPENNARAERQIKQPIRVIVGNPPYSVGQRSANDNNQNLAYPTLDARIANTYAAASTATNKNSLYDSYIRAFRWASDRLGEQGVICFVTNGGWLDGNTMDGFRKCLQEEFLFIYVFNLRGNARTQGELRRMEAGNVFGEGSRTPVAITLLIKSRDHQGLGTIRYHDIGDYLSREEKLAIIEEFGSIENIPWKELHPNRHHDWINQRGDEFQTFLPMDEGPGAIFALRSRGVETSRDAWVYNYSRPALEANVRRMIDFYNDQLRQHVAALRNAQTSEEREKLAQALIDTNPAKIKWTSSLISDFVRERYGHFEGRKIGAALYRPFCKTWLYYDSQFNHRFKERIFPTAHHENLVIQVTGAGESKEFSCLVSQHIPNLHTVSAGQCYPFYWYEKVESGGNASLDIAGKESAPDEHGYIRRDGILDEALARFRQHYQDETIAKEDIFWYVYGVLHSPEYRSRFAADLKKTLPRIPLASDFWSFSKAGRSLGRLHLDYETIEPWPLTEETKRLVMEASDYRVKEMVFGKKDGKPDKTVIVYNEHLTLRGVPLEAYEYVVNGKSAIEWVMERYAVRVNKDSGIANDPNAWCTEHGNPRYIVELLKRVVRVSVESVSIVNDLPALGEAAG